MHDRRIVETVEPDGTLTVRTTDSDPYFAEDRAREDAERQAALDAMCALGVPRPVVFRCIDRKPKAAEVWSLLRPTLVPKGIPVFTAAEAGNLTYVVPTDVVREALKAVFGKKVASRLFRVPLWPVSYWTVYIDADQIRIDQSRTLDIFAAGE